MKAFGSVGKVEKIHVLLCRHRLDLSFRAGRLSPSDGGTSIGHDDLGRDTGRLGRATHGDGVRADRRLSRDPPHEARLARPPGTRPPGTRPPDTTPPLYPNVPLPIASIPTRARASEPPGRREAGNLRVARTAHCMRRRTGRYACRRASSVGRPGVRAPRGGRRRVLDRSHWHCPGMGLWL